MYGTALSAFYYWGIIFAHPVYWMNGGKKPEISLISNHAIIQQKQSFHKNHEFQLIPDL